MQNVIELSSVRKVFEGGIAVDNLFPTIAEGSSEVFRYTQPEVQDRALLNDVGGHKQTNPLD